MARIFEAGGEPSIVIDDKSIKIRGNDKNFIVVDDRGITFKGPISMIADSMSIRKGGLFVGINDFLEMLPSTIISPIPKQIPFPPMFMMQNIVMDLAFFMALMV